MIKDDVNLLFYIESVQDFGGPDRVEGMLGIYDNFIDAKCAMQDALLSELYNKYGDGDIGSIPKEFKDLLVQNSFSVEHSFSVVAAEQGVPLAYANQCKVFSVNLTDEAKAPINYYGVAEMGLEYKSNEKRISDMKERISEEFEKSDPNIPLTKHLQKHAEDYRKKKIFMESIVDKKEDLIYTSENVHSIMKNTTSEFVNNLERYIMEYDQKIFEKIKDSLDKNKNSGIMENAFKNAKKHKL